MAGSVRRVIIVQKKAKIGKKVVCAAIGRGIVKCRKLFHPALRQYLVWEECYKFEGVKLPVHPMFGYLIPHFSGSMFPQDVVPLVYCFLLLYVYQFLVFITFSKLRLLEIGSDHVIIKLNLHIFFFIETNKHVQVN